MKKLGIVLLLALWVMAGVQLVYGKNEEEDKIVEVLAHVGTQGQSCAVEYYGVCKGETLDLEGREEFLREIAGGLGIGDSVRIVRQYDREREETKLIKEARRATTTLRLITASQEGEEPVQYLIANISMDGTMEDALGYRRILEELLEEDMTESKSSANVIGTYEGELELEERNRIADGLLEHMGAHVVTENRDMQLYTIYGYTPYIGEYQMQEDEAVNINIAMYYSRTKDETYVYAAVPVIGLDY